MKQASVGSSGWRNRRGTNVALLVLVPATVLAGLFANTIGVNWAVDPAAIHAVLAIAALLLAPWKSTVVRRGLRRRRSSRWASLALMLLVVVALASGIVHATDVADRIGPLTVMQIHIGAAVGALVLMAFHYRAHPVKPRVTDLGRRSLLEASAMAAVSVAVLGAWEWALDHSGLSGGARRFTGSHERSSFVPHGMPHTVWLDDRAPEATAGEWMIHIDGESIRLSSLAVLPRDDVTAILDCTSGWYSEQVWTGVRLDRLVEIGDARSIEIGSSTGYARRFPASDAARLWLVTEVGGEPLSTGHGFPARLVAPNRRGFWWVKWVNQISTSDRPWWIQSPFPVT